ncbi:MAG: hypothetical protein ACK526_00805 [Planctomyces sp.]
MPNRFCVLNSPEFPAPLIIPTLVLEIPPLDKAAFPDFGDWLL